MTLTPGNPMRVVLLSILLFEVVVYGLAIPVMILVSDVPVACGGQPRRRSRAAGPGRRRAAAAPGRLSGRLDHPAGRGATGLLTAPMFIVGAMFLALWVISFILGKRLDGQTAAAAG